MKQDVAIRIDYWAEQEGNDLWKLEGIKEFQDDLSQDYISRVRGHPGDLGGGLYELAVQVIANISAQDFVNLVASGVAFDLMKVGVKSFFLRPFLAAYEKLKALNHDREVDIHQIEFIFNDAEVLIKKICANSIYESLGEVIQNLAKNFGNLRNSGGELPYTIQIPVFEDPEKILCRFRVRLDVDETIEKITAADYFGYWGISYEFERASRVFDVKRMLLIDSDFLTSDLYWQKWKENRSRRE